MSPRREVVGQEPLGGPARPGAVGVAGLLQHRVDRGVAEVDRALDAVQEAGRLDRPLEQVVQPVGAVAHPEHVPELAQPPGGQAVARRQPHVLVVEPAVQPAQHLEVAGVAGQEVGRALAHPRVGALVDVVDRPHQRRQAARDQHLAQRVREEREVGHRAEPAEALAEHAPALDAERLAHELAVPHDRVRPEQRQVLGLLLRRHAGQRPDRAPSGRCRAGRASAPGTPAAVRRATPARSGGASAAAPPRPARPAGRSGTGGPGRRGPRPPGRRSRCARRPALSGRAGRRSRARSGRGRGCGGSSASADSD